jgi:hypothetical protein
MTVHDGPQSPHRHHGRLSTRSQWHSSYATEPIRVQIQLNFRLPKRHTAICDRAVTSEPSTPSADPRYPFTYAQQSNADLRAASFHRRILIMFHFRQSRFSSSITVLRSAVARVKGLKNGEPQDSRLSECNSILTTALTRPVGRRHSCTWPAGRQATHIWRRKKPAVAYFALRHSAFPSIITLATRLFVLPAEHTKNLTDLHTSRQVTILSVTFRVSYSTTNTNINKQHLQNTKGTNKINAASVSHRLSVIGHADCTYKQYRT